MTVNNENPKLKPGLRQAYRSACAPPWLAQRVLAQVEGGGRSSAPWLKYAGGLLSVVLLMGGLATVLDHGTAVGPRTQPIPAAGLKLSSIRIPGIGRAGAQMPGPASLGRVPALNRFQTPATDQYTPDNLCLYPETGEISC